jgi:uncharacterized protein with HEPN domain
MTEDRLKLYVERMESSARRAVFYVDGMGQQVFEADQRTQDAVIANIAAVGECAIKIMDRYPAFVSDHPEIAWMDIRAMRDRIAHQYFRIDCNTIWITVRQNLPDLIEQLDAIINWRAQGE